MFKYADMNFHSGILGHLAESSVICTAGGSVVHVAIASARPEAASEDFLPLTVDYKYRQYAQGELPKTVNRREKGNSDEEILVSRVIDRAIRPLFPSGYVNDLQITVTTHSVDSAFDVVSMALNATSVALLRSQQPWNGPLGCVRVGCVDGTFVVNPTQQQMESSTLDLIYAGTEHRTLM